MTIWELSQNRVQWYLPLDTLASERRPRTGEIGRGAFGRPPVAPGRSSGPVTILAASWGLYIAALAAVTMANAAGPEKWWWSTVNLYLPQWAWGVPVLPLTGMLARRWPRHAWLGLLPLFWVAGPIMGLCWSPAAPDAETKSFRVMSYNVEWGRQDAAAIARTIGLARSDLVLLQDGSGQLAGGLRAAYPDWHLAEAGQYIVLSRFPLQAVEVVPLSFSGDTSYLSPTYLRCRVRFAERTLTVFNTHLLTPRHSLVALRRTGGLAKGLLEGNAAQRLEQAARLARDLRREKGPVLLAGDLNAPTQSLVCRQLFRAGLRDSFADGGRGYGYTFGHSLRLRHSFLRIDHILVSRHWRVLRCWTGAADGSDHRPVITDLLLEEERASGSG